jgi:hypothetical protein
VVRRMGEGWLKWFDRDVWFAMALVSSCRLRSTEAARAIPVLSGGSRLLGAGLGSACPPPSLSQRLLFLLYVQFSNVLQLLGKADGDG